MFICGKQLMNFYKYKRKLIIFQRFFNTNVNEGNNINKKSLNSKLKILFFGTDNFSLPSFKVLHSSLNLANIDVLGAVTSFKSPANCVRLYCEQNRVPLYRWPIDSVECRNYDLGVVVSFGHLIPESIIKAFPLGMINLHASLLPRWRGAAPIIYALMNDDKTTGVTIMKIAPKHFDVGDILAQRELSIRPDILMPELHTQLASEGADLLMEVIDNYPRSFENAKQQDPSKVTYAPKIKTAITQVNWSAVTAIEVYNRYRALYGFKHLQTHLIDKNVQLIELSLPKADVAMRLKNYPAGSIIYEREHKSLLVCCADNTFVQIHRLRIEGRKLMSALEFNNGFLKKLEPKQLLFLNKCTG